jgi:hypothetical protein
MSKHYKIHEVVAVIRDGVHAGTPVYETVVKLHEIFPGIADSQIVRAARIVDHEEREAAEEADLEVQAWELLLPLFEGLPEGTTLAEAVSIKAAQGDPIALSYQSHNKGRTSEVALWEAAVAIHPRWQNQERGYSWNGEGEPPSFVAMIDWFQTTYPREARAIEDLHGATP